MFSSKNAGENHVRTRWIAALAGKSISFQLSLQSDFLERPSSQPWDFYIKVSLTPHPWNGHAVGLDDIYLRVADRDKKKDSYIFSHAHPFRPCSISSLLFQLGLVWYLRSLCTWNLVLFCRPEINRVVSSENQLTRAKRECRKIYLSKHVNSMRYLYRLWVDE